MAVRFETDAEPIPGYRLIDRLGSGGFGEVWKAEAPGGIFKAIKIIHGDLRSKDDDLVRYAEQELKAIKRVKSVRHPYLLSIDRYDIVDGRLLIVMELADCNLWDRFRECRVKGLPGIPREELLTYMAEAAEVLDLMNDQFQLQHLDIKPQNLFLLFNHVKVADFGQVKDLEGHMASVTGGITPVYAAPETFDGFVSRFCDQYSLACVYQELLTGARPFDGSSMQQLLTQHLQLPPNLDPSPPADRPALARALAKKPEDRFPNIITLVRALRQGGDPAKTPSSRPAAAAPPAPAGEPFIELAPAADGSSGPAAPALPRVETPYPAGVGTPPPTEAVPEQTGPGPVRPAVLIGIGQTGLRVLQAFRKYLTDRYGPPERLPAIRFLFVDTDPDTLAAATDDGPAALHPDEVFAAKLSRAGHYLKPRLNGRSLIEGWFDAQLLYKLPRTPSTMGLRPLGRLAFCDYYRPLTQRIQAELDVCTHPDALSHTTAYAGLELRTNRPRVYVVAGLGGATGGGMFLDVAYAVRTRLRRMGYEAPDVTGVLLVPPDGADGVGPQAQANAYAALTELNHYARPDTVFQASYDDRYGTVRDPAPPFTATVLFPGPADPPVPLTPVGVVSPGGASGRVALPPHRSGRAGFPANRSGYAPAPPQRSGVTRTAAGRGLRTSGGIAAPAARPDEPDPCATAADYIRFDLLAPLGRMLDATRPPAPPGVGPVTVRTAGLVALAWPRGEVIARTARYVAGVVFDHWVTPNFGRAQNRIPGWAAEQLSRLRLDADGLVARLRQAADRAVGQAVEPLLAQTLAPLVPRGWRPKAPDPTRVTLAFAHLDKLVGTPLLVANPPPNPIDEAVGAAAADAVLTGQAELTAVLPALVDDPEFRLAGAEEATRQLLADVDRALATFADQVDRSESDARDAYEQIWECVHQDGGKRTGTAEVTDALRRYPVAQYSAVLARHALKVYEHLKQSLVAVLGDVSGCRQRLEGYRQQVVAELEEQPAVVGPRQVMPQGCPTVEAAAKKFLSVLSDDDLAELEHRIQVSVEQTTGGLYHACLNSAEGAEVLLRVVREEARAYLDGRLGEVDLAGMFAARFGGPDGVARAFAQAFADAAPTLIGPGPWSRPGVAVVGAPTGPGGAGLRQAAAAAADVPPAVADTPDEVLVYREYPHVPLTALPQCGPAWVTAYHGAAEQFQCTPHTRADVTQWVGVDS